MAAPVHIPLTKEDLTAWRDMLGTPKGDKIGIALLIFTVQSLLLPFANDPVACGIGLAVTAMAYYFVAGSFTSLLGLALPAFLVYAFAGLTAATAFTALVVGGALGGYLLLHFHSKPKHLLLALLPVGVWGAVFLLTGSPVRGLLALLPVPMAAVFAYLFGRCSYFTETVVAGAAAMAITLSAALLLTAASMGVLNGNFLPAMGEMLRGEITAVYEEMRELYAQAGVSFTMTDGEIANIAAMIVNLSPAIFLIASSVLAFCSYRTMLRAVISLDGIHRMPRRSLEFSVSVTAAVLFILSFLAALLAGTDHTSFFGTLMQNLYLVLEPGLILIGFGSLAGRNSARSCLSWIILMGLVYILFTNPGVGLTLTAFYGALLVIMNRFAPSPEEKGGH